MGDGIVRSRLAPVVGDGHVGEVNREQGACAIHLGRHAVRGEHLGQLVLDPCALSIQVLVDVWRQLFHCRNAGCHTEWVAVVGPALREIGPASRVHQLHHIGAPAKGGHRQAAADDLPHRREVRGDAVELLSAAWRDTHRDHLVKDEKNSELAGHRPESLDELVRRRDHAAGSDDRLEDHRRHAVAVTFLAKNPLGSVWVVEREDHAAFQCPLRRAYRVGRGIRAFGRACLSRRWMRADLGVVVGAVVAALDPGNVRPSGEGPGQPHRKHGGLGPRVAETHEVQARDSLT